MEASRSAAPRVPLPSQTLRRLTVLLRRRPATLLHAHIADILILALVPRVVIHAIVCGLAALRPFIVEELLTKEAEASACRAHLPSPGRRRDSVRHRGAARCEWRGRRQGGLLSFWGQTVGGSSADEARQPAPAAPRAARARRAPPPPAQGAGMPRAVSGGAWTSPTMQPLDENHTRTRAKTTTMTRRTWRRAVVSPPAIIQLVQAYLVAPLFELLAHLAKTPRI